MTRYTLLTILVLFSLSCTRQQSNPTTYTPLPTIASFSPEAANIGAEIIIRGQNFSWEHSGNTVKFGTIDAPVLGSTKDWVKVNVPVGATTGRISVIVNGKTATSGRDFVLATGTWGQKLSFPGNATQGQSGFSIGGLIYVVGGISEYGFQNELWSYDPSSSVWTRKAAFPGLGRFSGVSLTIGNKAYFGLGFRYETSPMNDFWEYDPATDQWTKKADFPTANVFGPIGFGFNTVGFVGLGSNNLLSTFSTEIWMFTPATNTWLKKGDFPGENGFGVSACADQNRGYILFGNSDKFWQYDPNTDQWSQFTQFSGDKRKGGIAFISNGKIYAGLGYDDFSIADFWEFDLQNHSWTRKADFVRTDAAGLGFASGNSGGLILATYNDWDAITPGEFWEFAP